MGIGEGKRYFVLGEAPGAQEDKAGIPFIGAAGKRLNQLLELAEIDLSQCYITNVCKCADGQTQVYLEDGKRIRLDHLVKYKKEVKVRGLSHSGKRVIGWYKTPLAGRKMFKISYKDARKVGKYQSNVKVTEDHLILTSRGYVPALELTEGDLIATGTLAPDRVGEQVIAGSLLGDAYIGRASLEETHGIKQKDYTEWKARILAPLGVNGTHIYNVNDGTGKRHDTIRFWTTSSPYFRSLREKWYPLGKKKVPWDLKLTPISLAVWFMDDGSLSTKKILAEIAVHGFDSYSQERLQRKLAEIGLTSSLRRGRLFFNRENTNMLLFLIAPYVPNCMSYKLRGQQFPAGDSLRGGTEMFYSPARKETWEPKSPWVYCIDVEDDHCFSTPGGVLHNCLPPKVSGKRRAPRKAERLSCYGWLQREFSIIKPKYVIALGATPLSLFSDYSISQVHGTMMQAEIEIADAV
uniref:Putative homing endonuclease n=1 Tax=viral metagenome TaxID=1070528 RepID=A0A6M3L7V3_9ZZZZ